jgi:hypothetical protein
MPPGMSPINRALNRIPKRAEQRQSEQLRDTFVDSGIVAALDTIDHQILYGRRGTGKTHALRYLESEVVAAGEIAVYVDLRTIGSPDGLFLGESLPATERAARLLVDLVVQLHESILTAALDDESLITDANFVGCLDRLLEVVATVRVTGESEVSRESEANAAQKSGGAVAANLSSSLSFDINASSESSAESRALVRETQRGVERIAINFGDVARALRDLARSITARRIWFLLDEWSSIPTDIQPLLGEFLLRTVLPLQMFTVKIAAIEQQANFRGRVRNSSQSFGIELGADIAANISLDDHMVFEQNEDRARDFFKLVLLKHLTLGTDNLDAIGRPQSITDLVRATFSDRRAFDELVRAAEGVPRDAINIAAMAGFRAGANKISVPDVRAAARSWFLADKEAALQGRAEARRLLNWIVDRVVRQKRARGFLVNQSDATAPLLLALFDARVLHIVQRGYSAQDSPGERYDVWMIDYGAFVDLINTQVAPRGMLPSGERDGSWVDVPTRDLRAIRRAILEIDEFELPG